MKTEISLRKSMDARRDQCIMLANEVQCLMEGEQDERAFSLTRKRVADLCQCFHEYNAYRNALETK